VGKKESRKKALKRTINAGLFGETSDRGELGKVTEFRSEKRGKKLSRRYHVGKRGSKERRIFGSQTVGEFANEEKIRTGFTEQLG